MAPKKASGTASSHAIGSRAASSHAIGSRATSSHGARGSGAASIVATSSGAASSHAVGSEAASSHGATGSGAANSHGARGSSSGAASSHAIGAVASPVPKPKPPAGPPPDWLRWPVETSERRLGTPPRKPRSAKSHGEHHESASRGERREKPKAAASSQDEARGRPEKRTATVRSRGAPATSQDAAARSQEMADARPRNKKRRKQRMSNKYKQKLEEIAARDPLFAECLRQEASGDFKLLPGEDKLVEEENQLRLAATNAFGHFVHHRIIGAVAFESVSGFQYLLDTGKVPKDALAARWMQRLKARPSRRQTILGLPSYVALAREDEDWIQDLASALNVEEEIAATSHDESSSEKAEPAAKSHGESSAGHGEPSATKGHGESKAEVAKSAEELFMDWAESTATSHAKQSIAKGHGAMVATDHEPPPRKSATSHDKGGMVPPMMETKERAEDRRDYAASSQGEFGRERRRSELDIRHGSEGGGGRQGRRDEEVGKAVVSQKGAAAISQEGAAAVRQGGAAAISQVPGMQQQQQPKAAVCTPQKPPLRRMNASEDLLADAAIWDEVLDNE